ELYQGLSFTSLSSNPRRLFLAPFTLLAGVKYAFHVTASFSAAAGAPTGTAVVANATVAVAVQVSDITVAVAGGNSTVYGSAATTLDAGYTADPDDSTEMCTMCRYNFSCVDSTGAACGISAALLPTNTSTSTVTFPARTFEVNK
ncbi:unnamed protein product, partial [Phaeothamnion confervicola]